MKLRVAAAESDSSDEEGGGGGGLWHDGHCDATLSSPDEGEGQQLDRDQRGES